MTVALHHPAWATYTPPSTLPAPIINDPRLPLVTVVTPSFNQGRFIAETIKSVLDQDYPNLEYWVIDGGSRDETLEVIKRYEHDPRLHWFSERDKGQSDAVNKGWARSQGQIIGWLNSDDTYLPHAISNQVKLLLANPQAGAVYGDAWYIDPASKPLTRIHSRPYDPLAIIRLEMPIQPTLFMRREIISTIGPLRHDRYSLDTEYWARALYEAPFVRNTSAIATYRLHSESKTVAGFDRFCRDWIAIAEDFFADKRCRPEWRAQRQAVLADIYSAAANLELRQGRLPAAARYTAAALALGGLRPRMLKLPISLIDRFSGGDLAAQATRIAGRLRRAAPKTD